MRENMGLWAMKDWVRRSTKAQITLGKSRKGTKEKQYLSDFGVSNLRHGSGMSPRITVTVTNAWALEYVVVSLSAAIAAQRFLFILLVLLTLTISQIV